ncbi:MAG: phage major capsid protein [Myxococcaceae bacterium]|nr:phage major capsid protein [Myxococcaceae bacterium]
MTKEQMKLLALAAVVSHAEGLAEKLNTMATELESGTPATAEQLAAIRAVQAQLKDAQDVIAEKEQAAKEQEELLAETRRAVASAAELSKPVRQTTAARITGGDKPGASRGTWGFQSEGEFIIAARNHRAGIKRDPRILNAATTFGSEGVNEEGGFAVPPDYRSNIRKAIEGQSSLAALCDDQRTSSNRLTFPIDENAPWDSSSGIIVGYIAEGATMTGSKPKLGSLETKLVKLGALVPLTEELMQDAAAMSSYVSTKVPEKTVEFLNQEIITGAGSPGTLLGILNATAKVTAAAKAGQGANTVIADNIAKMWSCLPVKSRSRAVWLVHSDVEAVLPLMTLANQPVYLPPGGLLERPNGTLMGRPVIVCEDCKALGTEGDIILWDPLEYILATKTGPSGIRADVSMHVYFEQDMTAMRFIQRIGGQPWWTKSFARKNGSSSQSPIITLNSTRT